MFSQINWSIIYFHALHHHFMWWNPTVSLDKEYYCPWAMEFSESHILSLSDIPPTVQRACVGNGNSACLGGTLLQTLLKKSLNAILINIRNKSKILRLNKSKWVSWQISTYGFLPFCHSKEISCMLLSWINILRYHMWLFVVTKAYINFFCYKNCHW